MKIIFLSHTPRSSVFKVGSYHLSKEFVRMGHQVLYVPSALSIFHFLNLPRLGSADYRQSLKDRMDTLHVIKDEDGVLNLTPFVGIPSHKGIFANLNLPVRQSFSFNGVGKKLQSAGFDTVDLVIQDKPGLFFMRHFINTKNWIYRATDDYSSMNGGADATSIKKLEKKIYSFADQVIVTSAPLQKLFKKRYGAEASIIRNGVDVAHFTASHKRPAEYASIEKPIILYVGSLDERFDRKLILQTASLNPDYQYVIIGPGEGGLASPDLANITVLGSRPYEQIPAYMQHADVGILPLKLTDANHARSPMKMYEYGISGLPVVSTPLEELIARKEEFVTFAEDAGQFAAQISYSLDHKKELSAIAKEQSSGYSWHSIAKQLLKFCNPEQYPGHD